MTSNNEEQKETSQVSTTAIMPQNTIHKPLASSLSVIIAIAALFLSGYTLMQNHQLQKNWLNEKTSLTSRIDQLNETRGQMAELINTKTASWEQNQTELTAKMDASLKKVQTALSQQLNQSQDWLLLTARYYLELAQINGYWSEDYSATIALLQQADDVLKSISSPQLYDVRQAIAKEINLVKAIPVTDVTGILSQLEAAQTSISNLRFQSALQTQNAATTQDPATQTNNGTGWQARIHSSVNALEKLVIIRHNNEDIKPLISPLFESVLKETIYLNLQEAQWSVLNRNTAVYQLTLKQAIANVQKIFDQQAPATIELIKTLTALQQIKLTQEKPQLGQALNLLNQVINNKPSPAKTTNNGKGEHP